jgi:hypothetical protein
MSFQLERPPLELELALGKVLAWPLFISSL